MRHKLANILEAGLPVDKYIPLSAEVFEEAHNALWLDGDSFDRLKARALLHLRSGREGCALKCAPAF